jgi:hypothetical protein
MESYRARLGWISFPEYRWEAGKYVEACYRHLSTELECSPLPPLILLDTCLFMPHSIVSFLMGQVVLHWAPAEEQRLRVSGSGGHEVCCLRAALAEKGDGAERTLTLSHGSSLESRVSYLGAAVGTGLAKVT